MWNQFEYPEGNYVYPTWEDAYWQANTHAYPAEGMGLEDTPMDIWRVDAENHQLQPDPLHPQAHMITTPIHPRNLQLYPNWEQYEDIGPDG